MCPRGLGGRCYKLIFVRDTIIGGNPPIECDLKRECPSDSVASPCHQELQHQWHQERRPSKITPELISASMVSEGPTEGGPRLEARSSEEDN